MDTKKRPFSFAFILEDSLKTHLIYNWNNSTGFAQKLVEVFGCVVGNANGS